MASKGSGIDVIVFDKQVKLAAVIRSAIIEPVKSFQDLSSCISFIEQRNKVIVLITTIDDKDTLQIFESLESIEVICLLSRIRKDLDTLPSKVIGVYLQKEALLKSLNEILDTIELQLNARNILFNYQTDRNDNIAFYFYNTWKNNKKRKISTKDSFIKQTRLLFRLNNQIQLSIDDFEVSYKPIHVLTWMNNKRHYPFPYYMFISNALRTNNREILSLARFFLHDLEKQMKSATFGQVYLGTKLPINLIERLEQHQKTDVIAFQCFLLVTQSRVTAFTNATQPSRRVDLINVLFKIELNRTLYISMGDIFLIDMATPLYIKYVTRTMGANENQKVLVIVKLIALNRDEKEKLYEQFQIQQEISKPSPQKLIPKVTLVFVQDHF